MPQKSGAAKGPGRQAGEEHAVIRVPNLNLRSEETPAVAQAPAQADAAQGARIDDLFTKTLTRLQLGPGNSGDRTPDHKPQRRQAQSAPGGRGGKSPLDASNAEQPGADPLRGWAQKVLLTGPSPSERRQDLLEIVDTAVDPRRQASDQDRLFVPRRMLSRSSSKGSIIAPNTGRRAARSGSKLGPRQSASRPPELSPTSADADNAAASPWSGTVGGSSSSGLPPSPFSRSTREALQEGMDREVTAVFTKFAVEYEIESCELLQALFALGHRRPRVQWVDEILEKSYSGRSYLDKGEFAEFVEAYRARFLEDIGEKYRSSDLYINGSLTMLDLSTMLRREGITPLPGMIRELFTELVQANGGVSGGGMGFEEYLRVYDIVHERGGFTRAALIRLHVTFERFDGNADGRLAESEVKAALHWLGLEAFADEDPKEGKEEAAADAKRGIAQAEFLSLVSRCHEREVSAVNSAFAGRDAKLSGSVNIKDLPAIFEDLGYTAVTPHVCKEACAACNSQDASGATQSGQTGGDFPSQHSVRRTVSGWGKARMAFIGHSDKHGESDNNSNLTLVQMMDTPGGTSSSLQWRRIPKDLLFEDFYAVVDQVRDTHCLSCTERAEAVEAFELHAASKAKGISLVEMTKAVRWIGYPVHLGRLLEIFDESDLHDSYRRRDAQEFMRLVARIRADEVRCVRARLKKRPMICTCGGANDEEESDMCDRCVAERWGCGLLLASSFGVLLGELGHCASWEQVSSLEEAAGGGHAKIPLWSALQLLEQHRREERGSLRSNQSFSDSDVRRFQQRFLRLEGGAQGAVKRREIVAAVDELVGRKRRCKRLTTIAREVLQKTDPQQQSGEAHGDAARPRRNSTTVVASPDVGPVAKVDLTELLKIMRLLHDQDDEERLEKEQGIVREVGFSREEVREFRRLFHQASLDSEYRLTLLELERLVARVMPVTGGMQEEFKFMAMKAACVKEEEALDFGSFLAVMRNLLDQNWHNINEASETAANTKALPRRASS